MNLLAHALLSPNDPAILVGNLTADWIKGKARHALPQSLRQGIELHRKIDTFTDLHPLVENCSALLEPNWGRYSPVLVDIYFDHILSTSWPQHSTVPREAFIQQTYTALRDHLHLLPERAQYAGNALLADDWLSTYATLEGIALSLSRMSKRLNHGIELAPSTRDFTTHEPAFRAAFNDFFPQLRRHVETPALNRVESPK